MPRYKKTRRVCDFPRFLAFCPEDGQGSGGVVVLTMDEYEAIRLIDREGLSQEQCGRQMQVARTTVQAIYTSARKKLADALTEGLPFRIEGGEYRLCGGEGRGLQCDRCYKQKYYQMYAKSKGEQVMRIAVTYDNGEIFQHFGHTEQFKIYDVEGGSVRSSEVVDTNGSGHGALAGILSALGVDALICGGIGGGARNALAQAGIRLYGGVTGSADQAAEALAAGTLRYDPDVMCDHHGEHHHGEDHRCGDHGCGGHSCDK